MLKLLVITEDGAEVSVDLCKDSEFEIEIENPLLNQDRMPIPFSTEISLPPSDSNKRLFGYIDGIKLSPAVKKIAARILINEIEIASGTLSYTGIEEGYLKYAFSANDLSEEWNQKIWDISDEYNDEIFEETGGQHGGGGIAGGSLSDYMGFPIIVNELATGEIFDPYITNNDTQLDRKYRNYTWQGKKSLFTPAIRTSAILYPILDKISIQDSQITQLLSYLVILGQYYNDRDIYSDEVYGTSRHARVWFKMLPDITMLDLIKDIAKICCAAIYKQRNSYRLVSSREIFNIYSPLDWSGKISNTYSMELEGAQKYRLSFANTETAGESTESAEEDSVKPISFGNLVQMLNWAKSIADDYKNFKHQYIGDIYAIKKVAGTQSTLLSSDCIDHFFGPDAEDIDSKETFEVNIKMEVVKCTPEIVEYVNLGGPYDDYIIAPVVPTTSTMTKRANKVYVGLLVDKQMCDKGIVVGTSSADQSIPYSLRIDSLYARFHSTFKDWISTDRDRLSADVNLSLYDISSFAIWQTVFFANRRWLVAKLIIHINGDGEISSRGEFISI